jgi:hypothetical protein
MRLCRDASHVTCQNENSICGENRAFPTDPGAEKLPPPPQPLRRFDLTPLCPPVASTHRVVIVYVVVVIDDAHRRFVHVIFNVLVVGVRVPTNFIAVFRFVDDDIHLHNGGDLLGDCREILNIMNIGWRILNNTRTRIGTVCFVVITRDLVRDGALCDFARLLFFWHFVASGRATDPGRCSSPSGSTSSLSGR